MRELLSVIVPCYNEGAVIERTAKAIVDTCTGRAFDFEIIFVNDGSKDDTLAFLKKLAGRSEKIKYISFSRNFGKEAAMLSGLEHCKGSCAVIMDADLQHPPELIVQMYEKYQEGYEMKAENSAKIQFDSLSANEAFARGAAAAFLARYDPTVPQLADIKTAVSEAVTNCIVHAYPDAIGPVTLSIAVYPERLVKITVTDKGIGIPDVEKAMEPLFTTGNPEERSGLGFAVMQSFMDKVKVSSQPGKGTRVVLTKRLDERST